MPPLILSPSFNSTGSVSAPPNLTISGTMSAASGFVWGTQGAIIDEYAAGNQIRMYTNTAGKGGWFYFPAGLTVNNSLYITGNSVLSASATDVYTTLQNSSTGGRTWHINATSSASGEGGGKLLIKDGTASATRLAIDSSGNVGIGTSSPAYLLTVAGDILRESTIDGAARLNIRNLSTGINAHTILNIGNDVSANSFVIFTNSSGRTGDGGTGTTTLRTDYGQLRISSASNGIYMASNVGIGTSSPATTLHVYTSAQSAAQVQSTNASGCNFTLDAIAQDARYILAYNGSPKWYIANWQSQSNRMYIFDSSSAALVYLAQGGTNWTSASDSRLKDVQGTITNALDKVQQLTGVKFTWKRESDNPDAKVRVGLIAQDVQAVLPEAVDDDSPDLIINEETGKVSGGLGVRYTELVPLLVNAIKELTARVVALESQISSGAA